MTSGRGCGMADHERRITGACEGRCKRSKTEALCGIVIHSQGVGNRIRSNGPGWPDTGRVWRFAKKRAFPVIILY